jgi:hypothetical protein
MKNYLRFLLLLIVVSSSRLASAQVPIMSSYPQSSAVLFLDFDGHTFDNTIWNFGSPIACAGSGLNSSQITEIFNRVAEDYRPFALNITTDSAKYWAAPFNKRMRVIITVTYNWYGSGAGGVATVGTFGDVDNTPCFVFSSLLGYNVKQISEAVSHEAGHTLWLYHQAVYDNNCVKISDYNTGTGSGEIGWAPIMGVGYYQNMTLWNLGPNTYGCSSIQNDIDKIITQNGLSLRTDDYAATFASATNITFTNNQFTTDGIITQNTDQDMFKFNLNTTGRFTLSAIPYNVGTGNAGSDLDLQVSLYNSSQILLNVYNPGVLLSSVIDTSLNPGTYYLKVEGRGNIYAPNYASLGSYSLQGTFGSTLPLRRLELKGSINNDLHQLSWVIDADEQVAHQVLEYSTDGRHFTTLNDPADLSLRHYNYRPTSFGTIQYRLNVTFDNGRQYYSNIVTLKKTGSNPRPELISNFITDSKIEVQSPGNYAYSIFDYSGKAIKQGNLVNGSNLIQTPGIVSGGMYIIRFNDAAAGIWVDKFIRQ